MKKFNLIALLAVFALMSTGAYAREASFEEMLGGDSGTIVRGLNAADLAGAQKIAFPVPAGMESCKYASVQGDTCSFICKSGATVTRPRLNSSVAQNGGCALFVMVPVQNKAAAAVPAERSYASRGDYSLANDARAAMELAIAGLKSVKGVEVIGGGVFPLPGYRFGYNIVFNSALKPGVYQYPYAFASSDEAEEAMAGKTEELSSEGKYPFVQEVTAHKSGGYSFSVAYLSKSKGIVKL